MPSAEWLQKGQSSFRNIKKKKKSCLLHTYCLAQQVPSLCKASKGWARVTQTHCSLVPDVPDQAHSSHGRDTPKEGGSWHKTQ